MLLMLETPHREGCESVAINQYDGCLSCRGGRFVDLNSFVIDHTCRLVERSRNVSERDRFNKTKAAMADWDKSYDADADDIIKDVQPHFNGQPTVYLSSAKE